MSLASIGEDGERHRRWGDSLLRESSGKSLHGCLVCLYLCPDCSWAPLCAGAAREPFGGTSARLVVFAALPGDSESLGGQCGAFREEEPAGGGEVAVSLVSSCTQRKRGWGRKTKRGPHVKGIQRDGGRREEERSRKRQERKRERVRDGEDPKRQNGIMSMKGEGS